MQFLTGIEIAVKGKLANLSFSTGRTLCLSMEKNCFGIFINGITGLESTDYPNITS
jgi:hypothetical protein